MRTILAAILTLFATPSFGQVVPMQPPDLSGFATAGQVATAQSTASGASTAAAAAQTTANTGVTNAATAQAKANTSVQTVNSVAPTSGDVAIATISNGSSRMTTVEATATLYTTARAVQYATPTTGQTVVSNGSGTLAINPAGPLVGLTVTLPSSPGDGQSFTIATSQAITTLTISGGTLVGTLNTMALGGYARLVYGSTAAMWFRAG